MLLDRHPQPALISVAPGPRVSSAGQRTGSASGPQSFPGYEAALRPPPILRQTCEEEQE